MSELTKDALREELSPSIEIYQKFKGLIVAGLIGSGEKLPTVRQVAKDLGVAPGTAAKAFKLLERDGLVTSKTGAGTRVSDTAALLSGPVVAAIRALASSAKECGASSEDVISALRATWGDESD